MMGRVVKDPKVQTGGGDNLNAGYSLGITKGLEISQCILLGMAASGSYVLNGRSSKIEDLIDYLEMWMSELKKS